MNVESHVKKSLVRNKLVEQNAPWKVCTSDDQLRHVCEIVDTLWEIYIKVYDRWCCVCIDDFTSKTNCLFLPVWNWSRSVPLTTTIGVVIPWLYKSFSPPQSNTSVYVCNVIPPCSKGLCKCVCSQEITRRIWYRILTYLYTIQCK